VVPRQQFFEKDIHMTYNNQIAFVKAVLMPLIEKHMDKQYRWLPENVTCLKCDFGHPRFPKGPFWSEFVQLLVGLGVDSSDFIEELIQGEERSLDHCDPYWVSRIVGTMRAFIPDETYNKFSKEVAT